MKKILSIFIIIFSLFLVNVNAKECDSSNIKITSIELKDKTDIVIENSPASIENKKINLNLKMYEVGDYAEYELKVKNNSNDNFYFDEKSLNINSDYFDYNLKYKNNSNEIKPGEEKTINLRVEYKKEIEKEKYYNGSYINTKPVSLNISDNKKSIITNPLTKNNKLLLIIIFIIIISTLYFIKKKKHNNILLFILGVFLILPFTTYALCKINIEIEPNIEVVKVKPNPCTYDGELVQDAEYVNGQYTYRYMQEVKSGWTPSVGKYLPSWINMEYEGWGVVLTDKESTDPVTTKLCTSINGKPIVSMREMFSYSKTNNIDLSSFDTSNVVSMYEMFMQSLGDKNNFKELDLSSFDTSKVKNMEYMFQNLDLDTIDISMLDVSNVESINGMFSYYANIDYIDMKNMNFKKLKEAINVFYGLNGELVDLSGIQANKLNTLEKAFFQSEIKKVDLSNLDTPNLKNMEEMFMLFEGEEVILNGMDTSNATDMGYLFGHAKVSKIDLRNIDTSSVVNIKNAFQNCTADEILFPESFSFGKGADLSNMFQNTIIPTLNLEGMDTSNVSNMSYMFQNASAKDINLSKKFSFDSINTDVISWSLSMVFWNVNVNTLDFRGVDVKKIRNTDNFFSSKENATNSSYGTIYVRSEEDAEWLRNNGTYNPNNFNYVVKQ